jgi:hypothetical protein
LGLIRIELKKVAKSMYSILWSNRCVKRGLNGGGLSPSRWGCVAHRQLVR